ncbi:MAG: hypothetical protein GY854_05830 [Deltaproteobacteria bacterium]|nr:hypothetical protein [Deltaproteobacteria bacterium]
MSSSFCFKGFLAGRATLATSTVLSLMLIAASLQAADIASNEAYNVLFVANGASLNEDAIENHLNDFDSFVVTRLADKEISAKTPFFDYDLVVLTEAAPSISREGMIALRRSQVPVLAVEETRFRHAARLGLVRYARCNLSRTDAITAAYKGVTTFSRFVGDKVLVHEREGEVCGVRRWRIRRSVAPVYYSNRARGEVAVMVDHDRRHAVLGLGEVTRYTRDAWRLFDVVLSEVLPRRNEWRHVREQVAAYVRSGLPKMLEDVRKNPDAWDPEDVIDETWRVMVDWELYELADWMDYFITDIYPNFFLIPPLMLTPFYVHPVYSPGDDSLWFMGQEEDGNVVAWDQLIAGTDLGISANLWNKTFVYMGDTIGNLLGYNCHDDALCNDAIVGIYNGDNNPYDGIKAFPYTQWYDGAYRVKTQVIPDVHDNPFHSDYWDPAGFDPEYTVPTGAVLTGVVHPFPYMTVPTVMLWYGTAIAAAPIIHGDPQAVPRSWANCSTDGLTFTNCYGPGIEFSVDEPDHPARFIQVSAVNIWYHELIDMCGDSGYDTDNPLCDDEIYDTDPTIGGMLLFGNGRFYRISGVYVAYIRHDEIGQLNGAGRPLVHYLAKDGSGNFYWSDSEHDAVRILPENSPALDYCDTTEQAIPCIQEILDAGEPDWERNLFGEFSVKLISNGIPEGESPYLVMLSGMATDDIVQYRHTRLDEFWQWPSSVDVDAHGYGNYIVDKYTRYKSLGDGSLSLFFLSSKWDGVDILFDYGVYSDKHVVSPWPPI